MTPEQFERLPKYARLHIMRMERQRDAAVDTLKRFQDDQTESGCWFEESRSNGPYIKRYVQSDQITVSYLGVELTVTFRGEHEGMFLSWGAGSSYGLGECCLVPTGHQQARLKNLAYHPDDLQRLVRDKEKREAAE